MFGRTSILVSWIERGRGIVSLGALGDCNWIQLSSACRWKPVEFLRFGGLFAEQDGWMVGWRPGSQLTPSLMSDV